MELDTGKRSYASNFHKKTPGWEDLNKVACLWPNGEFKPEARLSPRPTRDWRGTDSMH